MKIIGGVVKHPCTPGIVPMFRNIEFRTEKNNVKICKTENKVFTVFVVTFYGNKKPVIAIRLIKCEIKTWDSTVTIITTIVVLSQFTELCTFKRLNSVIIFV